MAIRKFDNKANISPDFDGTFIGLNNGDRDAMNTVIESWNFKDTESFLRFAIAILLKTKDSKKIVIEEDGHPTTVSPGAGLIKEAPEHV